MGAPIPRPQTLNRRARIHDLAEQGYSQRAISDLVGCSRDLVRHHLKRARPTPEEIQQAEYFHTAAPRPHTPGGLFRASAYIGPETRDRLLAETDRQGANISAVLNLAIDFYLSWVERARNGTTEDIPLKAFNRRRT